MIQYTPALTQGANRVQFGYTYWDNENNIRQKTFDHRSGSPYNDYTYDDIDRLTAVAYHNSDTEGFVMDDLGNRDGNQTLRQEGTVRFTPDPLTNRYTAIDSQTQAYDDAGGRSSPLTGKELYPFHAEPVQFKKNIFFLTFSWVGL